MRNVSELMRVLQFGDSMLPVGAFSFSNGLESAVQEGIVHDLETLRQFVQTCATQAATGDGIAVLETHRAAQANDVVRILAIDQAVNCRKLNEEIRVMSTRMGRKLAEMAIHVMPSSQILNDWLASVKAGTSPGSYPVAQALVFAALGLSEREVFTVHQYGVASMMLGAALRLMRISYLDTQAILFEINQHADAAYDRIAQSMLEDMCTFAPMVDILASIHVRSNIRMFMN